MRTSVCRGRVPSRSPLCLVCVKSLRPLRRRSATCATPDGTMTALRASLHTESGLRLLRIVRWLLPLGLAAVAVLFEFGEHATEGAAAFEPAFIAEVLLFAVGRSSGRLRDAHLGGAAGHGRPGDIGRAGGREPRPGGSYRGAHRPSRQGRRPVARGQCGPGSRQRGAAPAGPAQVRVRLPGLAPAASSAHQHQRCPRDRRPGCRRPSGQHAADAAHPHQRGQSPVVADPDHPRRIPHRGRAIAAPAWTRGRGSAAGRGLCHDARRGAGSAVPTPDRRRACLQPGPTRRFLARSYATSSRTRCATRRPVRPSRSPRGPTEG